MPHCLDGGETVNFTARQPGLVSELSGILRSGGRSAAPEVLR